MLALQRTGAALLDNEYGVIFLTDMPPRYLPIKLQYVIHTYWDIGIALLTPIYRTKVYAGSTWRCSH